MSGPGEEREIERTGTPREADQGIWKQASIGILLLALVVAVAGTALSTAVGPAVGGVLLLLAIVVVASSVEIVQAYEQRALTVFGDYRGLVGPGLNFVPPFVSDTTVFDLRTQTVDVPKQEAITRDNSPVVANAVIYIRVMNAERAFLEVENYERAVSNLAQTTLRAVLGDMELDDTLSRRREINERIREELAGPTDEWGVRVESVEVQEITPSKDVLTAMEQQTAAERRRRAMILEAQGERRSAIEKAQGDKQSNIIEAQGEKQAQILEAQGDAISTVLRAKAAESMGERAVVDRGMEALESIGQSPSTTYVLPQEVSSLLGRYGKHLTGSTVSDDGPTLESLDFDQETRDMLGLDDIENLADGIRTDGQNGAGADPEIAAIEEADDGIAESQAIREADDNVAESEVLQEADAADAGAETDTPSVDAGAAAGSVEDATEQVKSAVEDAVPDVDVAVGDDQRAESGTGEDSGSRSVDGDPTSEDASTSDSVTEAASESADGGETGPESETETEQENTERN